MGDVLHGLNLIIEALDFNSESSGSTGYLWYQRLVLMITLLYEADYHCRGLLREYETSLRLLLSPFLTKQEIYSMLMDGNSELWNSDKVPMKLRNSLGSRNYSHWMWSVSRIDRSLALGVVPKLNLVGVQNVSTAPFLLILSCCPIRSLTLTRQASLALGLSFAPMQPRQRIANGQRINLGSKLCLPCPGRTACTFGPS